MNLSQVIATVRPCESPAVDILAFPCAGGGPGTFRALAAALPPGVRLSAVCLPGRDSRYDEPFAPSLAAVGDEALAAWDERERADRVVFLGHSMGAFLALSVAVRATPEVLIVAAAGPPSRPRRASRFSDEEQNDSLRDFISSQGVDDPRISDELIELTRPILLADLALLDTFRPPRQVVGCDIWAYYGGDDEVDPWPWTSQTSGQATATVVEGDHFFVRDRPGHLVCDLLSRLPWLERLP
jgi:surfactin synthase thioesterase subunit